MVCVLVPNELRVCAMRREPTQFGNWSIQQLVGWAKPQLFICACMTIYTRGAFKPIGCIRVQLNHHDIIFSDCVTGTSGTACLLTGTRRDI